MALNIRTISLSQLSKLIESQTPVIQFFNAICHSQLVKIEGSDSKTLYTLAYADGEKRTSKIKRTEQLLAAKVLEESSEQFISLLSDLFTAFGLEYVGLDVFFAKIKEKLASNQFRAGDVIELQCSPVAYLLSLVESFPEPRTLIGEMARNTTYTVLRDEACVKLVNGEPLDGHKWNVSAPNGVDDHNALVKINIRERNN